MSLESDLDRNLNFLGKKNIGRLVIAGLGEDDNWRLFTGMGGRSAGSKNRYYLALEDLSGHGKIVRTAVHDMSLQMADPSTTLYTAHRQMKGVHVASNGEQTDGICIGLALGAVFKNAQRLYTTEGPKTDYTARISAAANASLHYMLMGRIERCPVWHAESVYKKWPIGMAEFPLNPGEGYLLTTYNGEGDTEPNYNDPMRIPLPGTLEKSMDLIWGVWDKDTKAGLCGKEIEIGSGFHYSFRSIHSERA